MYGITVFLHAAACVFVVIVILMQSGRGGGLTESFASAESMFGAKTNSFMVKTTTALAVVFFITSLSLAFMSSKKERSLMPNKVAIPTDIEKLLPAPETSSDNLSVEEKVQEKTEEKTN